MAARPGLRRDLLALPHTLLNEAVIEVGRFYDVRLEIDTRERLLNPTEYWVVCRGLLLGAMQTYRAICTILAAKQPKPFLLPAGVLNRSLFEILVTFSALAESPAERLHLFRADDYKMHALRLKRDEQRHGSDPAWADFLAECRRNVERVGEHIAIEYRDEPNRIPNLWPTPGLMLFGDKRKQQPPMMSGTRLAVLRSMYEEHYAFQSAMAHQRALAVQSAMLTNHPEAHWNPGHVESHFVVNALITVGCLLAEVQHAGLYAKHPKLAELWAYLRDIHEDAKDWWTMRYSSLV